MSLAVNQLIGFGAKRAATSNDFGGGNVSYGSIKEMCEALVAYTGPLTPTAGGTLTINSQSLGSYDFVIKNGAQTISSFTNSDWFTTTEDSRSAFIIVNGNLTINSGQTLIPSNRKLFTVVYVAGELAVSGSISMSARGANHSASGGNVSAAAIRIATGTFSGVSNPEVPATGASGGAGSSSGGAGAAGSTGSTGATGGGGAGGHSGATSGSGATGTSFSGGPGGGASRNVNGANGGASGAAGGRGESNDILGAGGGAGNPGGVGEVSNVDTSGARGSDGTGGVLIIICTGALSGAGTIRAHGANGGSDNGTGGMGGGASGGGSVTVMYGSDSSSITPTATGGTGGTSGISRPGGNGGDGTARKLAL